MASVSVESLTGSDCRLGQFFVDREGKAHQITGYRRVHGPWSAAAWGWRGEWGRSWTRARRRRTGWRGVRVWAPGIPWSHVIFTTGAPGARAPFCGATAGTSPETRATSCT